MRLKFTQQITEYQECTLTDTGQKKSGVFMVSYRLIRQIFKTWY